jgi:hypothetical protein
MKETITISHTVEIELDPEQFTKEFNEAFSAAHFPVECLGDHFKQIARMTAAGRPLVGYESIKDIKARIIDTKLKRTYDDYDFDTFKLNETRIIETADRRRVTNAVGMYGRRNNKRFTTSTIGLASNQIAVKRMK